MYGIGEWFFFVHPYPGLRFTKGIGTIILYYITLIFCNIKLINKNIIYKMKFTYEYIKKNRYVYDNFFFISTILVEIRYINDLKYIKLFRRAYCRFSDRTTHPPSIHIKL